ncbi:hypothetical protein ACFE04_025019 [Oxalis oulophora]
MTTSQSPPSDIIIIKAAGANSDWLIRNGVVVVQGKELMGYAELLNACESNIGVARSMDEAIGLLVVFSMRLLSCFYEGFKKSTDNEENIRACLARMESIVELSRIAVKKICDVMNQKSGELKSLNETVDRLLKEKEHIGSLLRSALSNRMVTDPSSKKNNLFQVAENGLREAGIDYTFSKVLGEDEGDAHEMEDEIYTLAGALEKIVKASQLKIIELRHSVEQLRVAINNGEAKVAYQATVNISAHVLKGFIYNKGGDEKTLFPKVPLESGKSRTSRDWTSPIVNPRDTFAASNDRR